MAASRYEKYVIRKPAVITKGGQLEIPDKIDLAGKVDTGPLVWCASKIISEASVGLESGIISGDFTVGTGAGGGLAPHKHDEFDELFLFMGTNPEDISDLGAEAEFWLGEGEELEKIEINTSTCVFVPAGLAHFPLTWKNVKRPCVFVVVSCSPFDPSSQRQEPASLEGRPR
jgi:uncharacterized RmlC-like cupin family protein